MNKEKLTNKEIMELTLKMLDDAKGTIKDDKSEILDEDGLDMIAYDLLWVSALPKALYKAEGCCPDGVKDDTMLLKLLLPFKRLKEIHKDYDNIKCKEIDDEIEDIITDLDDIANEIMDTKVN